MLESTYPYIGKDQACQYSAATATELKLSKFMQLYDGATPVDTVKAVVAP
jgi:hypothetical protein